MGCMAALNLRSVPEDVRHQFRILCTMRGVTMNDAIVALMRGPIVDAAQVDDNKAIKQAMKAGLAAVDWGKVSRDK